MLKNNLTRIGYALAIASSLATLNTYATIVEFQTSLGNFKVNLHDETTPKTVENFLKYVTDGDFDNTIIHRTVDDFIIQGGGARFEGTLPPTWIDTDSNIQNEPVYSNVTGTISMAKQPGNIDSANSQWFINTKNNSSALDPIDIYGGGAYAVFGEVIEDGMNVVKAIEAVQRCDTGLSGFKELPMPNYTSQQCTDGAIPGVENFVTIYNVVIEDSTVNTADSLEAVKNTLYKEPTVIVPTEEKSSGGGGSTSWLFITLTSGLILLRRNKN